VSRKIGRHYTDRTPARILRASGINEIAVLVGFQAEHIRRTCGPEITYIENQIFAETNSMYFSWLARNFFGDGFVGLDSEFYSILN